MNSLESSESDIVLGGPATFEVLNVWWCDGLVEVRQARRRRCMSGTRQNRPLQTRLIVKTGEARPYAQVKGTCQASETGFEAGNVF